MVEVGNLYKEITDPMAIMIRDVELWPDVSYFCENFKDFSNFLGCPPRILGGIT
jgi:hypothetical protein